MLFRLRPTPFLAFLMAVTDFCERANIEVVRTLCAALDELRPAARAHVELIRYVNDRPGHDRRYAIDAAKLERELGWAPSVDFASGMRKTVEWYLRNPQWIESVTTGEYQKWIATNYLAREGA